MAQYQNQYDEVGQTEESGNPVGQSDEYGNPIGHCTGTTDGEYGSGTADYATATTEAGKYGAATGSDGTDTGGAYGKPVGQRDEYGNPIGHHTSTTDSDYGTDIGDTTATNGAGKYGGVAGTDIGGESGNPVGQRDKYENPIGHHTSTTGGEYGSDTVDYATTKTGAGKYGGAPGSAGTDIGGESGNTDGERDEDGNPIGHHTSTTDGDYGSGTVGYTTATTGSGKDGGAPGSADADVSGEYGNPDGQREEYRNPIGHHTSTTDGDYGSGTAGYATATTGAGKYGDAPSTGQEDDPSYATSTTQGDYYSAEQHEEKKGIIDKIKEKLPGHLDDDQ